MDILWLLIKNFSYVFAGIAVVLLLAKIMGIYEKKIKNKDKNVNYTLAIMFVLSMGVGVIVISAISSYISFPLPMIKYLVFSAMTIIVFLSSKNYIERSIKEEAKKI